MSCAWKWNVKLSPKRDPRKLGEEVGLTTVRFTPETVVVRDQSYKPARWARQEALRRLHPPNQPLQPARAARAVNGSSRHSAAPAAELGRSAPMGAHRLSGLCVLQTGGSCVLGWLIPQILLAVDPRTKTLRP